MPEKNQRLRQRQTRVNPRQRTAESTTAAKPAVTTVAEATTATPAPKAGAVKAKAKGGSTIEIKDDPDIVFVERREKRRPARRQPVA